jgi:hypothetical protein
MYSHFGSRTLCAIWEWFLWQHSWLWISKYPRWSCKCLETSEIGLWKCTVHVSRQFKTQMRNNAESMHQASSTSKRRQSELQVGLKTDLPPRICYWTALKAILHYGQIPPTKYASRHTGYDGGRASSEFTKMGKCKQTSSSRLDPLLTRSNPKVVPRFLSRNDTTLSYLQISH